MTAYFPSRSEPETVIKCMGSRADPTLTAAFRHACQEPYAAEFAALASSVSMLCCVDGCVRWQRCGWHGRTGRQG
jgi:hypothetical protein